MELLFVALFGLAIGAIGLAIAKPRELLGGFLLPSVGGMVAMALWVMLLWLSTVPGFAFLAPDQAWVWIIDLAITAIVCVIVAKRLPAQREHEDRDLLDRLSHLGRAAI